MTASNLILNPWRIDIAEERRWARQSTASDMIVCPERVAHKWRNPDQYRTGEAAVMGTGYHAALAAHYQARKDGDTVTRADLYDAARDAIEAEYARAGEHMRHWAWKPAELLETAWACVDHYIDGEHGWHASYEVLAVEVECHMPARFLPGLPAEWTIEFTVDLVLREPYSGRLILVDHKTSRRKWNKAYHLPVHAPQPSFYGHLFPIVFAEMSGLPIQQDVSFYFDIIQHQGYSFERRQAPITHEGWLYWADVLTKTARQLEAAPNAELLVANPDHKLCDARYCDWFDDCPYGADLHTARQTR